MKEFCGSLRHARVVLGTIQGHSPFGILWFEDLDGELILIFNLVAFVGFESLNEHLTGRKN